MRTFKNSWIFLAFSAISMASTFNPQIATTCTVNQSPVECSNLNAPGATAYGQITGLNTANGVFVNLFAQVWTTIQIQQASALASIDFLGSTDGPQRQGLAAYSIYTDGDHGGGAGIFAIGTIQGLGTNPLVGTEGITLQGSNVPFSLGVPFEVQASVLAQSFFLESGAGGIAQIKLQLFELDGTPVTIFDPVPEPSMGWLMGLGMAVILARRAVLA